MPPVHSHVYNNGPVTDREGWKDSVMTWRVGDGGCMINLVFGPWMFWLTCLKPMTGMDGRKYLIALELCVIGDCIIIV